MTIIIVTSLTIVLFSYIFYKQIHEYHLHLYVAAAIVAVLMKSNEANIVSLGYIPFSFMIIVMITGALDKGKLRKRLAMVRAELAVIGIILLMPHALGYLDYVLEYVGLLNAPITFYIGILTGIIAIPLFITSFPKVRKKMKYKEWKTLHKLAYVFYIGIAIHVMLIQNDRFWLYVILFSVYFGLKIYDTLTKPKKNPTLNKKTATV